MLIINHQSITGNTCNIKIKLYDDVNNQSSITESITEHYVLLPGTNTS